MRLTEQTQLSLAELREALADAQAAPPPDTTVPRPPPLGADAMRELTAQRPDLAKLVADRATALHQRAAEAARAHAAVKQIYADALARIDALLEGAAIERPSGPAGPHDDRKRGPGG